MTLPLSVKIKGRNYVVKRLPETVSRKGDFMGDCCVEKKTIRVATYMGQDDAASTLLHEVLHAMFYEYAVDIDEELEEELVLKLEDAIFQVLRDNRGAIQYILGEAGKKK